MTAQPSVETTARVREVVPMVLNGVKGPQIVKYAESQGWGIAERQVYRIVSLARKELDKALADERDHLVAMQYARLVEGYQRCKSAQKERDALANLQEINKLLNLYPATKIEHTGKDGAEIAPVVIYLPDNGRDRT